MNNTELHLEVLSYDDEYVHALEVGNLFEYSFNEYDDIDLLQKFTKDEEYSEGEFFLYDEELFIVDEYSYHSGSILARKVHNAVSIPLVDIEITEEFDDFCDYYISQDKLIHNKEV
jgi:hypothetical protein